MLVRAPRLLRGFGMRKSASNINKQLLVRTLPLCLVTTVTFDVVCIYLLLQRRRTGIILHLTYLRVRYVSQCICNKMKSSIFSFLPAKGTDLGTIKRLEVA